MKIAALWAIFTCVIVALGPATHAQPQTQSNLPPAENQYVDSNGAPLAGGSVSYYVPGTLTPIAPASPWYALWVEKTLAVEMIGLGAIVIARHAARRLVDGPPCASQLNEVTQRGEYPPAGPCPHSEVLLEATMLWGHPCCIKGGPWGYLKEDRLIPRGRPVSHVRAQLSPTNNIRLPAHRFGVVIEPHR
jgi:hypothetical protein